jgi:hypothetical protein
MLWRTWGAGERSLFGILTSRRFIVVLVKWKLEASSFSVHHPVNYG